MPAGGFPAPSSALMDRRKRSGGDTWDIAALKRRWLMSSAGGRRDGGGGTGRARVERPFPGEGTRGKQQLQPLRPRPRGTSRGTRIAPVPGTAIPPASLRPRAVGPHLASLAPRRSRAAEPPRPPSHRRPRAAGPSPVPASLGPRAPGPLGPPHPSATG